MVINKKNIIIRYAFVVLFMGLLGVGVAVKAGFVMFVQRDYWLAVADRFVRENVPLKPTRGNILSSDGKLMASSLPEYRIYMDFKAGGYTKDTMLMNHLTEICEGMHRIFPDKSAAEFKRHILAGRRKGSQNYLLYPKRISYIQYQEMKKLPVFRLSRYRGGFIANVYNLRKKPFGSLAARTLGDLYPDTAMGAKNGIELAFDSLLKGRDGMSHRQKVRGDWLNIVERPAVDGCDIVTTIDVDMQDICEKALVDKLKELDAYVGVAVLMEVHTGDVKAIVNMSRGSDGNYYETRNAAISDLMEPGSTFKTASIMVALEDGKITPDTKVNTGNGVLKMHGSLMRDHNWHRGGYGEITATRALEVSSNIGVSYLVDQAYGSDPQKFIDGLKRMSLDQPLHLQIPGEGKPYIKDADDPTFWKTTLPWMSIGYESQLPPINVLTFYNAIANNGTMMRPRFVKAALRDGDVVEDFPTEVINPKICSDRTLEQIRKMLEGVVSEGLGKAAGSTQFAVAGKTGTAQIAHGGQGYRSGGMDYLVSFCGYFPADKPQYSCIVSIKKPGPGASGGLMAGSVFARIAERVYAKNLHYDLQNAIDSTYNPVPSVLAGNLDDARRVLRELDVPVETGHAARHGNGSWGVAQPLAKGVSLVENGVADTPGRVPDVVGMGARDAVYLLERQGLRVRLNGVGQVKRQSIPAGSTAHKGQTVTLTLR